MNENIKNLQEDLERQKREELEASAENFKTDTELTEDEQKRIENLRQEQVVMMTETDIEGRAVQSDATEYMKSLDDKIAVINDSDTLKVLNQGDIKATAENMKAEARQRAATAFQSMAVNVGVERSVDDWVDINNQAVQALMDRFDMVRLDSDVLMKQLKKMSLNEICAILPEDFVSSYVLPEDKLKNSIPAKDRLLAAVAYLCVTGPELDYLNEYIDEETKLTAVSKQLLQCQVDFADMLKDEKSMSEIVEETLKTCPMDTSVWAKYIRLPNRVHNEFAQRMVIHKKYQEAYMKLMEEYPDTPENARARSLIMNEIMESRNKESCYADICDLVLMKELWEKLEARYRSNPKMSSKYLTKEMEAAVDRIRRSKQDVPFPGYDSSMKKTPMIVKNYIISYAAMLRNYNTAIDSVLEKDPTEAVKYDITPIRIEGQKDDEVFAVYAMLLSILMGRIMKKLSTPDATKIDAITLDAYFQLFCRMGMDIYTMSEVWNMMKGYVEYVLVNFK